MKFDDNAAMLCHESPHNEMMSKSSIYDSTAFDISWIKSRSFIMDANQNEGFRDSISKSEADQSPDMMNDNTCNLSDLHYSIENNFKDFVEPQTHSFSKREDSFESEGFYLEKTVRECELPEFVVLYRENSCHDVKDICIDEGMPPNNIISYEADLCIPIGLKSNAEEDSNDVFATVPDSHDLMFMDEGMRKADVSKEIFSLKELFSVMDSTKEVHNLELLRNESNEVELHSIQIADVESPATGSCSASSSGKEKAEVSSIVVLETVDQETEDRDSSNNCVANNTSDNVNEECVPKSNYKLLPQARDFDDANNFRVSIQEQYSGETSFSAAGPVNGSITYSGPIAYSGSLSLRSDSSTTSARSFAFPVLQNEWNRSPVRMAKAKRRYFWKSNGLRVGMFCCRF